VLELNEVEQSRKDRVAEIRAQGIDPFGRRFDGALPIASVLDQWETLTDQTVRVRGRVMAIRGHGKACFLVLADMSGRIQLYVRSDDLQEPGYEWFRKYVDAGDIIGVEGPLFVTRTGEKTVAISKAWLLSKAVRTLPEKFHGLTDVELRYRRRYVDLMVNTDVRDTFVKRSKVVSYIRTYLTARG